MDYDNSNMINLSEEQIKKATSCFKKYIRKIDKYIMQLHDVSFFDTLSLRDIQQIFKTMIDIINNNSSYIIKIDNLSINHLKRIRKRYLDDYWSIYSLIYEDIQIDEFPDFKLNFTKRDKEYFKIPYRLLRKKLNEIVTDIYTGKLQPKFLVTIHKFDENHPIKKYINSDQKLKELNKRRERNIILYDNSTHQIVYDLHVNKPFIDYKIPFSDIEYDTNRKYVEETCLNFLYNFNHKKEHYIELLKKKNKELYHKQIEFIQGKEKPNEEELLVLVSLLSRLEQENIQGPITRHVDMKLNPDLIKKNKTNLIYIKGTINTLIEYGQIYLNGNPYLSQITNADFNVLSNSSLKLGYQEGNYFLQLKEQKASIEERNKTTLTPYVKVKHNKYVSTNKIKGNIESPHYIESFFRKYCELDYFRNVIPLFNSNEDFTEWILFSKRFKTPPPQQEFVVAAKIRTILNNYSSSEITNAIKEVYKLSKKGTYCYQVADYLLNRSSNLLFDFYRLFFIFNNNIEQEKYDFLNNNNSNQSDYNDKYISIASDMHLNNLSRYEKLNFSRNFNIIAGDFVDNLFHRGYIELKGTINIEGVGVLGNHDIYITDNSSLDLKKEINGNYQKSIEKLNELFPNIKILNDEILYKDGYAIIGMTLIYDIDNGERTFFANEKLGLKFIDDDYIQRAKNLLDQVPESVPIIFITHSPFKEYAVCSNQQIGVPSNKIFKDYPNVKVYIHGHGHSKPNKKVIDGILCITNPILLPNSISQVSFTENELNNILRIDRSVNYTLSYKYE